MTESKEPYNIKLGHGGARIPGPGKKLGRPTGKTRKAMTFRLPLELAERLRGEEDQTRLLVRLLSEYYGVTEL